MRLHFAPVLMRHVCGWSCWPLTPSSTTILHIDLESSVKVVGATWNPYSSTNITDDRLWYSRNRPCCCDDFDLCGNNNGPRLTVLKSLLRAFWRDLVRNCSTRFVCFYSYFLLVRQVVSTLLASLVLELSFTLLIVYRVAPIEGTFTRLTILVGFSIGSSHIRTSCLFETSLLVLWDELSLIHSMRFSEHNAHESTLFVDPCVLDWCFEMSVDYEGVIDDPGSIANKF